MWNNIFSLFSPCLIQKCLIKFNFHAFYPIFMNLSNCIHTRFFLFNLRCFFIIICCAIARSAFCILHFASRFACSIFKPKDLLVHSSILLQSSVLEARRWMRRETQIYRKLIKFNLLFARESRTKGVLWKQDENLPVDWLGTVASLDKR